MEAFRKWLDRILNFCVIFLTVFLLVVTSIQVFWRYVFNDPIAWSEELARFTFVWLVFLGGSAAFRDNKHMSVDLILPFLSPGARRVQDAIVKMISGAFLVLLLVVSPEILEITWSQPSASLSVPMAVIYGAFPFAGLIMLVYLVLEIASCRKAGSR